MYSDSDIKIAGDKPSLDIKKRKNAQSTVENTDKADIKAAREWGKNVAREFILDSETSAQEKETYFEMLHQRRMLLSFTATVGFEQLCENDTLSGIAQKSFLDTVKKADPELFKACEDTGAYSFYYLAFRRGSEIERRIGQTFAMLCSHDGDPIYQELGEALYCWFLSVVKNAAPKKD